MPEFAPAETPTAGQGAPQGQAVASRASLNQETSSRLADEPWGIAMREAHALQRERMSQLSATLEGINLKFKFLDA